MWITFTIIVVALCAVYYLYKRYYCLKANFDRLYTKSKKTFKEEPRNSSKSKEAKNIIKILDIVKKNS